MSDLTAAQRTALAAVFDTFVPPDDGTADARARFVRLLESLPDRRDRARIRTLISLLDSPLVNLVFGGRPRSFTAMDSDTRTRVLLGWAHSAVPLRRAGFQALKRLACLADLGWPRDRGSHPVWRDAGYPGPLARPSAGQDTPPVATIVIDRDTTLDCDVAIAGSGAGGGVAAGVLAAAGKSVVVLEKGEAWCPADFTQIEGDMLGRFYLDGGALVTQSGTMPILAGSCVGGGTVINYSTSFALPESVRAEWDALAGTRLFSADRFAESIARVSERLGVTTACSAPGMRDQILERGCRALGWHVAVIPRNVRGCPQGLECGYCGFGCRHGAKQSTAVTYLADAVTFGARIVPRCDVRRVLREGGRAVGLEATVRGPDGAALRLTVRAKVVIAACGAIETPALLARSALENPRIGRGLRLHPATAVAGVFDERVEPWSGALQTRYSDECANLDGSGYGAKFETAPIHFGLAATAFAWSSAAAFRRDLAQLRNLSVVGILLRDRDGGRIAFSRDGRPRVHYECSERDVAHVRRAIRAAAQLLAEAGAHEVFTLQQPAARARPGSAGWHDDFAATADRTGYRRCRMTYVSFHQMASCAMGAGPTRGVVDETGEVFEAPGLYVADGSAFPTSSGVNPMITIMAIADHVARGIADTW